MSPAEFGNHCVRNCKCEIPPDYGNENAICIMNPRNGACCYIPYRYRKLLLAQCVKYCIKLQIEIITEGEFLRYE